MSIEIVDLPTNSTVDLSSSLCKRLPGRVTDKVLWLTTYLPSILPEESFPENPAQTVV